MSKRSGVLIVCLLFLGILSGQQKISLYDEGHIPNARNVSNLTDSTIYFPYLDDTIAFMVRVAKPDLTIFLPEKNKASGIAVIICPGGGYSGLATSHEGEDMARRFQAEGIAGIVLKYRLPNPKYVDNKEIVPLQDAQQAIKKVRENALTWGIDPNKIGILGSSAGGHLASTAGTHFQKAHIDNPNKTSLRPDFLILNYPVISFADSLTHHGSRYNLIGPEGPYPDNLQAFPVSEKGIASYSNELKVTKDTPPTFITHAVDDDAVKVQNSILFMSALQQNRVPVEAFFYAKGGHGYGMDNPTSTVNWMDSCLEWIKKIFE